MRCPNPNRRSTCNVSTSKATRCLLLCPILAEVLNLELSSVFLLLADNSPELRLLYRYYIVMKASPELRRRLYIAGCRG
jgi:hypothetical protein